MAGFKVHRILYQLEPSSIKTISLEPIDRKLAVLRFDQRIEIWNVNYVPVVERVIHNKKDEQIEAVAWYQQRLFATLFGGQVIEFDLKTLSIRQRQPVTSGVAWCLDFHHNLNFLAVGTDNGYINLFQVANLEIAYIKLLDKQEGPILSLKFSKNGANIVTGGVNAIRIWNVDTGHAIQSIEQSHSIAKSQTCIWTLAVTSDFTIISGDSHGYLTFWDGNTAVQITEYKTHDADIVAVILSEDEQSLYCSGVDPLIVNYSLIEVDCNSHKKSWVKSFHRHIHDRDVRGLALLGNKLYSGGFGGILVCSYGPPKTAICYPPVLSGSSSVIVTDNADFLLFKYSTHLEFWKRNGKYSKMLTVDSKGKDTIICASISPNGAWLFYSTALQIRLYSVTFVNGEIDVQAIKDLPEVCSSCSQAIFTPNNDKLIISPRLNGAPVIVDLTEKNFGRCQEIILGAISNEFITHLKMSNCGKYLAIGTIENTIVICNLLPAIQLNCKLPKYSLKNVTITAMAIHPKSNNLIVAYSNHKVIEYCIEENQLTKFSDFWPHEILDLHGFDINYPIINIAFHPCSTTTFLFYNDTTICVAHKNRKNVVNSLNKKIKSESTTGEGPMKLQAITKYKHIVHFEYLTNDEFLVAELSPLSLIQEPFRKKIFGAM